MNVPFLVRVDGITDFHIKKPDRKKRRRSQTEKNKYHTIWLICGILKIMIQMNLYTKQKTDSQTEQTILWLPKEGGGGGELEVWN